MVKVLAILLYYIVFVVFYGMVLYCGGCDSEMNYSGRVRGKQAQKM